MLPTLSQILNNSLDPANVQFEGFYLKNGTNYEGRGTINYIFGNYQKLILVFTCFSN